MTTWHGYAKGILQWGQWMLDFVSSRFSSRSFVSARVSMSWSFARRLISTSSNSYLLVIAHWLLSHWLVVVAVSTHHTSNIKTHSFRRSQLRKEKTMKMIIPTPHMPLHRLSFPWTSVSEVAWIATHHTQTPNKTMIPSVYNRALHSHILTSIRTIENEIHFLILSLKILNSNSFSYFSAITLWNPRAPSRRKQTPSKRRLLDRRTCNLLWENDEATISKRLAGVWTKRVLSLGFGRWLRFTETPKQERR